MTNQTINETWLRQEVIDTALKMSDTGLSPGRSGNVSCRWGEGMLITPSGVEYGDILTDEIVFVDANGASDERALTPSSEWQFHLSAYRSRADIGAIVHCHSLNATALACAHKPIPAFHYMVAVAGGVDIPLMPYATFGTKKLGQHVARGLKDRNACLLANHGQIAVGPNLKAALDLATEVETLAAQYLKVLEIGRPKLLDEKEMARVLKKFQTYGQQPSGK